MVDPTTIGGLGAITVLQLANLYQSRKTAQKLNSMVTKERCDERLKNVKEDIKHTNIRIMNHVHNGDGTAKITKV